MTPETWLALAAVLVLALAAVGRLLGWFRLGLGPHRWDLVTAGLRGGAALVLAAALALDFVGRAPWSALGAGQVALSVALAATIVALLFTWRAGIDAGGPVLDLMALGLVLLGVALARPAAGALTCTQSAIAYQIRRALFLVGGGGAIVVAASSVTLAFSALAAARRWDLALPEQAALAGQMGGITALVLSLLGLGLLVGMWWNWQTVGGLIGGDPRAGWMAVTWLIAAMSWLAWRLADRGRFWALIFAVLAAAAGVVGLMAGPQLPHLLGF